MIRTFILGIVFSVSFLNVSIAQTKSVRPDLQKIFEQVDAKGTFAFYDIEQDQIVLVNPERAQQRFFPASTFKIANSIIALETEVVADENEKIPYGGKPQPFKSWERDMSMREAIRISNVPIYQELARRIGYDRYEEWLRIFDYGNKKVRDEKMRFWLDGPLEISAVEQVLFLALVAQKKLPASKKSLRKLATMIRLESEKGVVLYGKTGWSIAAKPQVGWFVGWVRDQKKIYTFALNLEVRTKADIKNRKVIVKNLLRELIGYGG